MPDSVSLSQTDGVNENGKEPFDYTRFIQYYLHDTGNCLPLTGDESEDVKKEYEMRYNWHPEIKTVKEFAAYLNKADQAS